MYDRDMSFDLFVCDPTGPTTDDEIRALYEATAAEDYEAPDADDSPRIAKFLAALSARFPALEDLGDDAVDTSPWATTPERGDRWIAMCLTWSAGDDVIEWIANLAEEHGLVLLDPQDGTVYRPEA